MAVAAPQGCEKTGGAFFQKAVSRNGAGDAFRIRGHGAISALKAAEDQNGDGGFFPQIVRSDGASIDYYFHSARLLATNISM